ncbi:putative membrane protein [Acinetobacter sp. 1592897]|nr:putative membrane protein [Acinetobacter sp. 1592897]
MEFVKMNENQRKELKCLLWFTVFFNLLTLICMIIFSIKHF